MIVSFGDCRLDSERRTLERAGNPVRLTGKAFQLLELLLAARPNPLPKEVLFEKLWPDTFVSEANLASLIKEIRAAIGDDARQPRYLRTVHRFGYAFSGSVTEEDAQKPVDSIAVLPFANLSGLGDLDYLCDGIAESVINSLAAVEGLRVASRASSFRYRGRQDDVHTAARDLRVRAVLSGRVRTVGDQLLVQVELTDAARDTQMWGQQFQSAQTALFSLQEQLSREVVEALRGRVSSETDRRLRRRYTENAQAYELYLKGRHHWNRRTREGIERAIFYFDTAVTADPSYAPAWSGLADCYIALASRDLFAPLQLYPKAEAAARRALEADSQLAEAHASMGAIEEVFHWRWQRSEEELTEALRLDPYYLTARQWYALALAHRGRAPEAAAQIAAALEHDPLSFMLNSSAAVVHYLGRNFDRAGEFCARALEINPHYEPAHFTLGLVHQQRGRSAEAHAELEKALTISQGEPHVIAALGAVEAQSGDRVAAEQRLARLREVSLARHVSAVHFATIYIASGDLDRAFAKLEEAIEARSGWLVYLATEPRFDAVRGDERYRSLIARIGG